MDSDLLLVAGMVTAVLCVPALISAFAAGRSLRTSVALAAFGGAMIVGAFATSPEGYRSQDIPTVFLNVIARTFR